MSAINEVILIKHAAKEDFYNWLDRQLQENIIDCAIFNQIPLLGRIT